MSKFLSEVKGFTPVIDILANELGVITALVYGIVWRYCQMEDGVCKASRERIAQHAGISAKTVKRHLEKLCKSGYLKDTTPDRRNNPHIYANTGKAKIIGLLSIEIGGTESPTRWDRESNLGGTESPMMIQREYKDTPLGSESSLVAEIVEQTQSRPDLFDLASKTEEAQQREGQWTLPASNGLVTVAITCIYELLGSTSPKANSGTWRKLYDKLTPVLSDHGAKSEKAIRDALRLFYEEKPKLFDPWYASFPGQFGVYLGKIGDSGQQILKVGH